MNSAPRALVSGRGKGVFVAWTIWVAPSVACSSFSLTTENNLKKSQTEDPATAAQSHELRKKTEQDSSARLLVILDLFLEVTADSEPTAPVLVAALLAQSIIEINLSRNFMDAGWYPFLIDEEEGPKKIFPEFMRSSARNELELGAFASSAMMRISDRVKALLRLNPRDRLLKEYDQNEDDKNELSSVSSSSSSGAVPDSSTIFVRQHFPCREKLVAALDNWDSRVRPFLQFLSLVEEAERELVPDVHKNLPVGALAAREDLLAISILGLLEASSQTRCPRVYAKIDALFANAVFTAPCDRLTKTIKKIRVAIDFGLREQSSSEQFFPPLRVLGLYLDTLELLAVRVSVSKQGGFIHDSGEEEEEERS